MIKKFLSPLAKMLFGTWFAISSFAIPICFDKGENISIHFSLGSLSLIICIIILVIILIIIYFLESDNSLPKHLPSNFKSHPILIVDDNKDDREKMADILAGSGYDITLLPSLTDAKLTEDYGIIISDIDGAGPISDCVNVIKSLFNQYPYKIVNLVSSKKWKMITEKDIVSKRNDEYLKKLPDMVKEAMQQLNAPRTYWEGIELDLKKKYIPKEDINNMKNAFKRYIKSVSNN